MPASEATLFRRCYSFAHVPILGCLQSPAPSVVLCTSQSCQRLACHSKLIVARFVPNSLPDSVDSKLRNVAAYQIGGVFVDQLLCVPISSISYNHCVSPYSFGRKELSKDFEDKIDGWYLPILLINPLFTCKGSG